jgi:hypothetical protein
LVHFTERLKFLAYFAASASFLIIVIAISYWLHGMFSSESSGLLLGWDTPAYAWQANYILVHGPLDAIIKYNYPQFYVLLFSGVAYIVGDTVLVARTLPIFIGLLLIFANMSIVQKLTNNSHAAGLSGLLTVASFSFLRILSDLQRNLFAYALALLVLYLVPEVHSARKIISRYCLSFFLLLPLVAVTHFETYLVLAFSLMLTGILSMKKRDIMLFFIGPILPAAVLISIFPQFFLGYAGMVDPYATIPPLTFGELATYSGGSALHLIFLVVAGIFLLAKVIRRENLLAIAIFSWSATITFLVVTTTLGQILSVDFARRAFLLLPFPILLALTPVVIINSLTADKSFGVRLISRGRNLFQLTTSQLRKYSKFLGILVASYTLASSALLSITIAPNVFLTPYVSQPTIQKIQQATEILKGLNLQEPVVIFKGDPSIWFASLDRNYVGAYFGDHFAYYGSIENLLQLLRSEPSFSDPSLAISERRLSYWYYDEMLGTKRFFSPMYDHDDPIKDFATLRQHPILIITPELYNDNIPFYFRPFYFKNGIYLVPPDTLRNVTITYGPSLDVMIDDLPMTIRSEYVGMPPDDPSLVLVRLNLPAGYHSYELRQIPSEWVFARLEQGGALSFPDVDPHRLNGVRADFMNDPADSTAYWSVTPTSTGEETLDVLERKEGYASLKIAGTTDEWGNLGLRYDPPDPMDLTDYQNILLWIKTEELSTFSIYMQGQSDSYRLFYGLKEAGEGPTSDWKRFIVHLGNYTGQRGSFDLGGIDYVDFFISSKAGRNLAFWIDDVVVDSSFDLNDGILKTRVLTSDDVTVFFYAILQD